MAPNTEEEKPTLPCMLHPAKFKAHCTPTCSFYPTNLGNMLESSALDGTPLEREIDIFATVFDVATYLDFRQSLAASLGNQCTGCSEYPHSMPPQRGWDMPATTAPSEPLPPI